jgi:hypothetical protein
MPLKERFVERAVPTETLEDGERPFIFTLLIKTGGESETGGLNDRASQARILLAEQPLQIGSPRLLKGLDLNEVQDAGANSLIAGISFAKLLIDDGCSLEASGMLKSDDSIQELAIRCTSGEPLVQEVGDLVNVRGKELIKDKASAGRIAEVLTSQAKEGGIPVEIVSIKIPGQAIKVPLLELIAALLDELRPALVIRAPNPKKDAGEFLFGARAVPMETAYQGGGGPSDAGAWKFSGGRQRSLQRPSSPPLG